MAHEWSCTNLRITKFDTGLSVTPLMGYQVTRVSLCYTYLTNSEEAYSRQEQGVLYSLIRVVTGSTGPLSILIINILRGPVAGSNITSPWQESGLGCRKKVVSLCRVTLLLYTG